MSDVNDLIDEKSKLKMSDGIVEKQFNFLFKPFFFLFFFFLAFFFFLFFFHFVLHLHTPPSTQNLLYPSHDVYPDDYGSYCVDDDCC